MIQDNYQLLIEKLDQFIRKYYVNQLIRGSLYATGLILALFLGLNFTEYFLYLPPAVKTPVFWGFVGVSGLALTGWVVLPALRYFKLGSVISHEQAAEIVGAHFSNVQDKLLNILQLRKQAENQANRDLILASINQKSEEIKPVPFKAAINLTQNRRYLKYALPPLLLLLFMLIAAPSLIKNPFGRLFNYDKTFEREAPFRFLIDPAQLKVVQFQDAKMTVKVEGAVLPNEVFIDLNGFQYRLQKEDIQTFSYTFSNVQKDLPFQLVAGAVQSKTYTLDVIEKPNVAGFDVKLDFPDYVGRPDELLSNQGDLIVPAGTKISWMINAENTDDIKVSFAGGTPQSIIRQGDNRFIFSKQMRQDEIYKLFISNAYLPKADSVAYVVTVVPDLYPTIAVERFEDSLNRKRVFFVGEASDDYGLRQLTFNYQIKRASGRQDAPQKTTLAPPTGKQTAYQHVFNMNDLDLKPGDEVSYYFEVFDNDGINGSKSAKTNMMTYAQPSTEQVEKAIAKNNEEIKDDLKKAVAETKRLQQDVQKLREKLLQQKDMDWQMKKEAEKLVQRQNNLEKQIQEAKLNFEENQKSKTELNKEDETLLEKEQQMQKMFEELQSPELKDLLKQIEELMQKMNKEEALDKMEDFKFSNEEMQKQLERMEELFKQLEVENMMQEQIEKLEELAEKQEKLAEESLNQSKDTDELKKEQEALNKEFKALEQQQDAMEEKNKTLKRPEEMPDTRSEDKEINKDMNEGKEGLEQKQRQKAANAQKSAANKMKNKANKMRTSQQQGEQQALEEDIRAMRQLLENLVGLSYDQEGLIKDMQNTVENTPRYVKQIQQQKKLQGDFGLIEDSLQALATRQAAIQNFVMEKVTDIKQGLATSLEKLEDRRKYEGQEWQQRTMKNVNDLALMLSESMQNMQNQMSQMSGNQSCKKPGASGKGKDGKEPKDKMSQGQQNIKEQLQKMAEKLKNGQNGKGQGPSSKEFAQIAAQQAAMREALKKKLKELQEKGKGEKGLQEAIDQMEKTETDLVNKRLTNETLKRQEDILTRLLESEKAEREREQSEERKANAAKAMENQMPPSLQDYLKKRQAEIDAYKAVSPALKPYYKNLVESYFKNLKTGN